MTCPLCEEYRKNYPLQEEHGEWVHVLSQDEGGFRCLSSPIRCAFEDSDEFSPDNWCCETMYHLRKGVRSGKMDPVWHNDSNVGIIPIPVTDDPEENSGIQQGFLVMSWYKNRGATGQAIILWDDDEPRKLTLKTARFIIDELKLMQEQHDG